MVRDVVERVVPNPTPEDIRSIKAEAIDKAVESGAAADSVDVHIEIDPQTSKLTAIALGSTEVKTTDLLKECTAKEARELAAEDLKVAPSEVNEECATKNFYVFAIEGKGKHPVRILVKKGFIKVQRNDGKAILCKAREAIVISYLSYGKSLQFTAGRNPSARTITFVPVRVSWISQVL